MLIYIHIYPYISIYLHIYPYLHRAGAWIKLEVARRGGAPSISPPSYDIYSSGLGQDVISISQHSPTSNIEINVSGKYTQRISAQTHTTTRFGRKKIFNR